MAHLLRAKQAGIKNDFSSGLDSECFAIDDVARYGINSQISTLAYDPVQSLLAVGTNDTNYGAGQIYIFGQKRVFQRIPLPRKASVKILQFCAEKLVVVDSRNDIIILSLEDVRIEAAFAPPGQITALLTDPTLDYALIGLQNGDVVAYDLDRQALAPFKIPNPWKDRNPRARVLPVVTLALHPRDIGTLLIGHSEGAIIYSFQQGKPTKFLRYEIPPGAPGGDSDPVSPNVSRFPRLTQALWHPTGTFILTGHEDSSLVIWDPKEGRKVLARTLQNVNVDQPGNTSGTLGSSPGTFALKEPIFRVAWCSKENPDDTGILVAGGASTTMLTKGLTFLDLGHTPVYSTSSWQVLSEHFQKPTKQHILPTPPNAEVVDFCLIPRKSPHYSGSHDPIAVLALLASGEVTTLSFPSGHPITPTNQLHPSLTFVHPFVGRIDMSFVERTRWLGLTENRSHGPPILKGGVEAKYPVQRFANRNIVQTAHVDGTIRIWDVGHGDEIENEALLQVDVARAIGRNHDVNITRMSMSGATGELAVGLQTGEAAIFRWGRNQNFGVDVPDIDTKGFKLKAIQNRGELSVKEGLLPLSLLDQQQGSITAIKTSDVGFVGVCSEGGSVTVIDLRGPAIIYDASLRDIAKQHKHGSFRKSVVGEKSLAKSEWAVTIDFSVMSLEGEDYSSILLFLGTNHGRFLTFKILPESHGGYTVKYAGCAYLDESIISISPINAETGAAADATQDVVASLRNNFTVNGVVLVATSTGVRIFKPAAAKGAHKSWDEYLCYSGAIARYRAHGYTFLGVFGDGCVKAFSIPGLKEVASANIANILDVRRLSEATITPTGDICGWTGPSEIALLNAWGTGDDLTRSLDKLFNREAVVPPRPTISNLQWLSGSQFVTPTDMDIFIGGPDRPPSKRMMEQMRADEQERRLTNRQTQSSSVATASHGQSDEGYWAYMQRQVQERTANLGIMGDSMDKIEDSSSSWANDVNKFVNKQKKKAVMSMIGSKLGL